MGEEGISSLPNSEPGNELGEQSRKSLMIHKVRSWHFPAQVPEGCDEIGWRTPREHRAEEPAHAVPRTHRLMPGGSPNFKIP
jgi:hypothetical protein